MDHITAQGDINTKIIAGIHDLDNEWIASGLPNTYRRRNVLASDFSFVSPPAVDIPSMICQQEKNYYYWLTSSQMSGDGAIVELGSWLGSSTAYLAAGAQNRPIHCFDAFAWNPSDNWKSGIQLQEGEDFSHLFLANMETVGASIIANKANLFDFEWGGSPIELIVIDIGKRADELAYALMLFCRSFVPGRTLLVLQDYQYFPGYQISLLMDAIRTSVQLEHVVIDFEGNKQTNSAGFRVTAPIDHLQIAKLAFSLKDWRPDRIRATWDRIMEPLPEKARARLAPGYALFLSDMGFKAEAASGLSEMKMDNTMLKRWRRLAGYPLFSVIYPELFAAMRSRKDWAPDQA